MLNAFDLDLTVLPISLKRVGRLLAVVVVFTVLASGLGEVSRTFEGSGRPLLGLLRFFRASFNPNADQTVISWLTASLLLGCTLLLRTISSVMQERPWGPWRLLGWLFVFLSLDEAISIHERVGELVSDRFETSGFFLSAWVIPYGALVLIVAVSYLPFLWRLPPDTRWRVILAGAVYVSGALGMEMIQARIVDHAGSGTLSVAMLAVVEEGLELTGAAFFLTVLLRHISYHVPLMVTVESY